MIWIRWVWCTGSRFHLFYFFLVPYVFKLASLRRSKFDSQPSSLRMVICSFELCGAPPRVVSTQRDVKLCFLLCVGLLVWVFARTCSPNSSAIARPSFPCNIIYAVFPSFQAYNGLLTNLSILNTIIIYCSSKQFGALSFCSSPSFTARAWSMISWTVSGQVHFVADHRLVDAPS